MNDADTLQAATRHIRSFIGSMYIASTPCSEKNTHSLTPYLPELGYG